MNPGDNDEWACSEVTRFMREYDEFIDRADRFSLDDDKATRLWEGYVDELPPAGAMCSAYNPVCCSDECGQSSDNDNLTDCYYELNLICVIKLPVCAGVCRRYKHSQNAGTAAGCSK